MQNRRAMLFLLLAAVCGISTAYAVRSYLQAHTLPAQSSVSMIPIAVSDAALLAATQIAESRGKRVDGSSAHGPGGSSPRET